MTPEDKDTQKKEPAVDPISGPSGLVLHPKPEEPRRVSRRAADLSPLLRLELRARVREICEGQRERVAVAAPTVPAKPSQLSKHAATPSAAPRLLTELEDALKTAIASAKAAEQYGQEIGYVVKFTRMMSGNAHGDSQCCHYIIV